MPAPTTASSHGPAHVVVPFTPARQVGTALRSIGLTFGLIFALPAYATATPSDPTLPDAPQPPMSSSLQDAAPQTSSAPATPAAPVSNGQTKRILGIIPNFRAATTNEKLPPQSVHEKFVTMAEDSFDYSALVLPSVVAAYSYGTSKYPEFGTGAVGYGRYLWHVAADQTVENFMVEFAVPALAHEDTRFYTVGHGGFVKRSTYALSRVVITKSDDDRKVFNAGEVVGAAVAAGISNAYYPSRERSIGNTMQNWGVNIGIDAAVFEFKEFWPDISSRLLHMGPRPGSTTSPSRQ